MFGWIWDECIISFSGTCFIINDWIVSLPAVSATYPPRTGNSARKNSIISWGVWHCGETLCFVVKNTQTNRFQNVAFLLFITIHSSNPFSLEHFIACWKKSQKMRFKVSTVFTCNSQTGIEVDVPPLPTLGIEQYIAAFGWQTIANVSDECTPCHAASIVPVWQMSFSLRWQKILVKLQAVRRGTRALAACHLKISI